MHWLIAVVLLAQSEPYALIEDVYTPITPQNQVVVAEAVELLRTGDTSNVAASLAFLKRDTLDAPTFHAVLTAFTKTHYRKGEVALLRRLAKTNPYDYSAILITGMGDWTHSPIRADGSYASSWPWRGYITKRQDTLFLDVCDFIVDSLGDDAFKFHPTSETERQIEAVANLSRLFWLVGSSHYSDTLLYPYLSRFPREALDTVLARFRWFPSDMWQASLLQWRIDKGELKVPWDASTAKMQQNYDALLDTIVYAFAWSGEYPPSRTKYPEVSFDVLRAQPEVYGPIIAAMVKSPVGINSNWFRRHPQFLNKEMPLTLNDNNLRLLFKLNLPEALTALFSMRSEPRERYWPPLDLESKLDATSAFPPDSAPPSDFGVCVSRSSCFRFSEYFLYQADSLHPDSTLKRGWYSTGLQAKEGNTWYPAKYTIRNDSVIVGELIPQFDLIHRYLDCAEVLLADSLNGEAKAASAGFKKDETSLVQGMQREWQEGIAEARKSWSKWNTEVFPTPRLYQQDQDAPARRWGNSYDFVSVLRRRFATWITTSAPIRPMVTDSDGDGWSDAEEGFLTTDSYQADSDSDGVNDEQDANPLCPTRTNFTDRQWIAKYTLEDLPQRYWRTSLNVVLAPKDVFVDLQLTSHYILHFDAKDSAKIVTKYLDQAIWYIPPMEFVVTGDSAKITLDLLYKGATAIRRELRFSRNKFGWKLEEARQSDLIDRGSIWFPYYNEVQEGC